MAHKDDIVTHTDNNGATLEIVGTTNHTACFVEVVPRGDILSYPPDEARAIADTLREAADLAEHKRRRGIVE